VFQTITHERLISWFSSFASNTDSIALTTVHSDFQTVTY